MSSNYRDDNRQAMPRCIDYSTASSLGLLRAIRNQGRGIENMSSKTREEWLKSPTIFTAIELLGEAVIIKDFQSDEVIKAARYIINKIPESSKFIRELADSFLRETSSNEVGLHPTTVEVHYRRIARLKETVRRYPYNPIAWCELSLCYATLNQIEKARSALTVALSTGANNRFILRSASRCFAHMGEPDRSVWILNRSGLCSSDPWIASAEIAICEGMGLKSACVTKGKHLLQDDNLTQFSRSELAVGLGTIEMKHGGMRRAKKLMRQALRDPTENALAQAQWMATQLGTRIGNASDIYRLEGEVPGSYEAQAIRSYYDLNFVQSARASELWGRFQQLSSRPIIHASHIAAAYLEDDGKAISILTGSMPAQQDHFLFNNNLAFSLIRSGEVEAGIRQLAKINVSSLLNREKLVLLATRGFVSFRTGNADQGRRLYSNAIDGLLQSNDAESAALAAYFLAREEKRIGSELAKLKIDEAKSRIKRLNKPLLDFLAKKL